MSEVDDAIARAEAGTAGQPVSQVIADRVLLARELKSLRRGIVLLAQDQHTDVQALRDEIERLRGGGVHPPGIDFALVVLDDREEDDENEHRG